MNEEYKCNQEGCEEPVVYIIHWPGKVPPPKMCDKHTIRAVMVMSALDLMLEVEKIK